VAPSDKGAPRSGEGEKAVELQRSIEAAVQNPWEFSASGLRPPLLSSNYQIIDLDSHFPHLREAQT